MKHNLKITLILFGMFVITQFIGLYIVNYYSPVKIIDGQVQNVSAPSLPYGMQPPDVETEKDFWSLYLPSIIFAFLVAILLLFFLMRFKSEFILRLWFFIVVVLAL